MLRTILAGGSSWRVALLGLVAATPAMAAQMFVPYPAGAAARGEHGTTVALMTVGPGGDVASCTVSRSSGSAELDTAACPLVTKDKHYPPAAPGDPLRLEAVRVNWVIPDAPRTANDLPIEYYSTEVVLDRDRPVASDGKIRRVFLSNLHALLPNQFQPGFEPVRVIAAVTVSPQLKPSACHIAYGSGYADLDEKACAAILESASFWVERDPGGRPRAIPEPSLPAIVLVPIDYSLAGTGKSNLIQESRGTFGSAAPIQVWSWLKNDDYPPEAIMVKAQGIVGAEVHAAAGRAIYCNVIESSGNKDLDSATCRIALKRGIFTPAHDVDGKPILGILTYRTRWVMPTDAFPPGYRQFSQLSFRDMDLTLAQIPHGLTNSVIALRYLVDDKGKAERCEVESSSGLAALDNAACKASMGSLQFVVVRDNQGQPLRSVQTKRIGITLQQ